MALSKLLTQMNAQIFIDVNLRPPWWGHELIDLICRSASWLKLNQDELQMLAHGDNDQQRIIEFFSKTDNIRELILTQAEQGAMAITPEGILNQVKPEANQIFIDSVGAGDAFSSVMLLGKYHSWPTELSMQRAQDFASGVVGLRGATTADKNFYQAFVELWSD